MIDTIQLISVAYDYDNIGNQIESESKTTTYCEQANITQTEFYNAKKFNLNIQHCLIINAIDYHGQALAEYQGERYNIVRTYIKKDERLEIYLAKN